MELPEGRLKELIQCIPGNSIIYVIHGNELRALWYSPDIPGYSGYTPDEYDQITAQDASLIILKNDLPIAYKKISEIQMLNSVVDGSLRLYHKTKGIIWIRFKAKNIGTRDGFPVILVIYTDVSTGVIDSYANAFESTPSVIYILDRQTWELYYINEAASRLWQSHDFVGKTCFQFAYGSDKPCAWCLNRQLADNEGLSKEIYDPHLKKYLKIHCRHINWYGRQSVLVDASDISDEKKAEEEYNSFLKELLAVKSPNKIGSFHVNLSRNTCEAGNSPTTYIGCFQDEGSYDGLLHKSGQIIASDGERDYYHEQFGRKNLLALFAQGQTRFSHIFPDIYEDGKVHPTETIINMVKNPGTGDVEGVIYSFDVSKNIQDQHIAQRLTRDEFDLIAIINGKDGSLYIRSIREGLGLASPDPNESYEAFVERSIKQDMAPEHVDGYLRNASLATIRQQLTRQDTYSFSFSLFVPGLGMRRKQVRYSYLDDARDDILCILLDETDAYRLEQKQLKETQEALQQANLASRAKSEFISRISHDIRTPLNAITSMTLFAREDIDRKEKLLDDLDKIDASSTFLLSLVNDVLDIARMDSGKMQMHPTPYLIRDYLKTLRNMFEPLCRGKGIHFAMHSTASGELGVVVDSVRFNQIPFNLLSNAVKYTPSGGSISYVSQSRLLAQGMVECKFTITDTGIGMDETFQKKMFEPFTQERVNPDSADANSGNGLGLAIVKRIVDLMGGTITVRSRRGAGTTVTVRLVLPQIEQAEKDAASTNKKCPRPSAAQPLLHHRVLLVEDNPINTEIAVRMLQSFGLDVTSADNGLKAYELFKNATPGTFAAVLMDIQMPVMDGYQTTARLRALDHPDARNVPILALTADVFPDAIEQSKKVGMNGFITKPIDPALLREKLFSVL